MPKLTTVTLVLKDTGPDTFDVILSGDSPGTLEEESMSPSQRAAFNIMLLLDAMRANG